jgi:hypothetical protein
MGAMSAAETSTIQLPEFDGDLDLFQEELEDEARREIQKFFNGKKFFCGGPIPNSYLMSDSSITLVVCTRWDEGVNLFYRLVAGTLVLVDDDEDDSVGPDVAYFLSLLQETHRSNVWSKFRAGMILLYLKLCKGYQVPAVEYNIDHYLTVVDVDDEACESEEDENEDCE